MYLFNMNTDCINYPQHTQKIELNILFPASYFFMTNNNNNNNNDNKLCNMKVTVRTIVIGALGTIPKGLLKELENLEFRGQVETIQTTAL